MVLRNKLRSYPKKFFLLSLMKFKNLLNKNLHLQVLLVLPVFWKILQTYPLLQILSLMKRKDLHPRLN